MNKAQIIKYFKQINICLFVFLLISPSYSSGANSSFYEGPLPNSPLQSQLAQLAEDNSIMNRLKAFLGRDNTLHKAIKEGKTKWALYLIDQQEVNLKERNKEGYTALHLAVLMENIEVVKALYFAEGNQAKDKEGNSLFHFAVFVDNVDILEVLLSNSPATVKMESNNNPLIPSIKTEQIPLKELNSKIPPLQAIPPKEPHLKVAPLNSTLLKDSSYLIIKKVNINTKNKLGKSPLHLAESLEMVTALIQNGADVDAKDSKGNRPLHKFILKGDPDILQAFLSAGANINVKNRRGRSLLHLLSGTGNTALLKTLLAEGADIEAQENTVGDRPLHWAIRQGQTETALILIKEGADINAQNNEGWTPLHIAVWTQDMKVIKALVEEKAEKNIQSFNGETALDLASKKSSVFYNSENQIIIDFLETEGFHNHAIIRNTKQIDQPLLSCPKLFNGS